MEVCNRSCEGSAGVSCSRRESQHDLHLVETAGKLRALGYYSGTGLHLGMGDRAANTWAKSCN